MIASIALSTIVVRSPRAATPVVDAEACEKVDGATQSIVRTALQKQYSPSFPGCSLVVAFPACAPQGEVTELVVESGLGHSYGTTLAITSFAASGPGEFIVTRLELVRGKGSGGGWGGELPDGVRVRRGTIASSSSFGALQRALAHARVLSTTTLDEKKPDDLSFGMWGTSSDFYVSLAIASTVSAPVERWFAGYEASDTQLQFMPLRLGIDRLTAIVDAAKLPEVPFDASARTLFVTRFAARLPTFDDEHAWWVREAFVRAAGDAGDARLLPALSKYLGAPKGDSSVERTRVEAINAIAVLARDDRRFAPGAARSVDEVAKDYLGKPPKP